MSQVEGIKTGKGIDLSLNADEKNIVLAGGCFWGTERFLQLLPGVELTTAVYANGNTMDPSYGEVCMGDTDHVEAVYVVYKPEEIDLEHLLYYFFKSFDPTQKDRQGNDVGRQYRNGIYYLDTDDLDAIKAAYNREAASRDEELATEIKPLENISKAEWQHQDYLQKNPFGYCHVDFNNLPDKHAPMKGDEF